MNPHTVRTTLNIVLVSLLYAVLTLPAAAQDRLARNDAYPISLGVNETFNICETEKILCPARFPICDDTSIATIRDEGRGRGLEIVGVSPGTTKCSVMSANAVRFVYSVTVR